MNMEPLLNILGKAFASGLLVLGSLFGAHVAQPVATAPAPAYGNFNPTGGTTYRLASSIGTTDTTIRLSSFKEPVSGIPYTMSYINTSIVYATLDPQTSKSEFISFTGISQNSNGTAVLSGVTRGLGRTPGTTGCTTASSTLKQSHAGQSILILSDAPCLFNEYAVLKNDNAFTGSNTFISPTIGSNPATKDYVDGKVFGGIGNASETATGTVEIATAAEAAASTANGSLGRLALPSSLSTSTYNSATAGNVVPVTGLSSKIIDPRFVFNGLSLTFPSAQGASSTALLTDGSGNLTWNPYGVSLIANSAVVVSTTNNSSTTLATVAIPASTFATNKSLEVMGMFNNTINSGGSQICTVEMGLGTGSATTTIGATTFLTLGNIATISGTLYATSTQSVVGYMRSSQSNITSGGYGVYSTPSDNVVNVLAPYSTAGTLYISFIARSNSGTASCTLLGQTVKLITK